MNRILIAVAALVLWTAAAFGAGWAWRADRADLSSAKRDKADAAAVVEAVQEARATEHKQADKMADIGAKHEEDRRDAQSVPGAVAAAVQSGALQLQPQWAGCATDRLAASVASAVELDALARLREQDAGRLVQIGREADGHVRGLQAVIRADRQQEMRHE